MAFSVSDFITVQEISTVIEFICGKYQPKQNISFFLFVFLVSSSIYHSNHAVIVSRVFRIQLFQERSSEKVHATVPKGIVGSFECSVTVLQRQEL